MATDGPTPPPCDDEVFEKGHVVFLGDGVSSNRMEAWVQEVAKESGQRVDWHFVGGRATVKALGDLEKVQHALDKLMAKYQAAQRETRDAKVFG